MSKLALSVEEVLKAFVSSATWYQTQLLTAFPLHGQSTDLATGSPKWANGETYVLTALEKKRFCRIPVGKISVNSLNPSPFEVDDSG
jgi:hypothetical protein